MPQIPLSQTVRHLPLDQVDIEDRTFLHTYPEKPPESLVQSISELGVVQPLVVERVPERNYRVVAGFRRFWAASQVGLTEVPVQEIANKGLERSEVFRWAVLENAGHRLLNPVEQALILRRLGELGVHSLGELLAFSAKIGGPVTAEQLERARSLLDLEPGYLDLAARNRLPDDLVDTLLHLRREERQEILHVNDALKLSFSRLRELVRLGSDVAKREGTSLVALFREPHFCSLLENSRLTVSQKTERFFRELKKRRYPRLSAAEARFEELRRQLRLPPRSRLVHSPSFEAPELTLELRFSNVEQFRRIVSSLQHLQNSPALRELLEFLQLNPNDETPDEQGRT